jgi:phosphohistidine phosphatase
MKVVVIRHAHAIDPHDAPTDESRHLTARGRDVARRLGERLRRDGVFLDAVVTSPLVRAVQTAELVAGGVGFAGEVQASVALGPSGSVRKAARELEGAGAVAAAVGHEPSISALVAHLAGRPSHASLRKGEAVIIDAGRIVATIDVDGE